MMLVFRSVTLSLASMANVSIVVGLFFLIFAIMGVQLFGGRLWSCNDTSVAKKGTNACILGSMLAALLRCDVNAFVACMSSLTCLSFTHTAVALLETARFLTDSMSLFVILLKPPIR